MDDLIINEPCDLTSGYHCCLTHHETFPTNITAAFHEKTSKGCQFVWYCHEHGYERAS